MVEAVLRIWPIIVVGIVIFVAYISITLRLDDEISVKIRDADAKGLLNEGQRAYWRQKGYLDRKDRL